MGDHEISALVAALAMAALHLAGQRMTFLSGLPRSAWLSAAGGVSVAYVFVHLLPVLAESQARDAPEVFGFVEHEIFLLGLIGLVVFYGVEHQSLDSRRRRRGADQADCTGAGAFWVSIGSFAVYNGVVGYLLMRPELAETSSLALYTLALGVHFVINDHALREHHQGAYDRVGRWIVAGAVLAGWALSVTIEISGEAIAMILAFLAGGVILNVFKEELPSDRQARLWPFVVAAALYAVLLQAA